MSTLQRYFREKVIVFSYRCFLFYFHPMGKNRQEQMKSANKLLDNLSTTEQNRLSEDLENKDEKDLKELIIQLRAELQHRTEVNKFRKQHVELKSTLVKKALLDHTPELGINANIELSKAEVKDSATQTTAVEGKVMGLKHEGSIASSEDKGKSSRLNHKQEQWQETTDLTSNRQENHPLTCRTNKVSLLKIVQPVLGR